MGLMIDSPATRLLGRSSERLKVHGLRPEKTRNLIEQWFLAFGEWLSECKTVDEIGVEVELLAHPPLHCGFGSGTQLALSVAKLMFHCCGLDEPPLEKLAKAMSRGRRSAIGSYGFSQGGFLVDAGVNATEQISPLDLRSPFPAAWRIVLLYPTDATGLHGQLENLAFDSMVDHDESKRERLVGLCKQVVGPAIVDANYDSLGAALLEFNRSSGEYFEEYQDGCYHSQFCEQLVGEVRKLGVDAVGQSSWGPCVFAIVESADDADQLVSGLQQSKLLSDSSVEVTITTANNTGATVSSTGDVVVA